jgi:hypothetical protein
MNREFIFIFSSLALPIFVKENLMMGCIGVQGQGYLTKHLKLPETVSGKPLSTFGSKAYPRSHSFSFEGLFGGYFSSYNVRLNYPERSPLTPIK